MLYLTNRRSSLNSNYYCLSPTLNPIPNPVTKIPCYFYMLSPLFRACLPHLRFDLILWLLLAVVFYIPQTITYKPQHLYPTQTHPTNGEVTKNTLLFYKPSALFRLHLPRHIFYIFFVSSCYLCLFIPCHPELKYHVHTPLTPNPPKTPNLGETVKVVFVVCLGLTSLSTIF